MINIHMTSRGILVTTSFIGPYEKWWGGEEQQRGKRIVLMVDDAVSMQEVDLRTSIRSTY